MIINEIANVRINPFCLALNFLISDFAYQPRNLEKQLRREIHSAYDKMWFDKITSGLFVERGRERKEKVYQAKTFAPIHESHRETSPFPLSGFIAKKHM